MGTSIFARTPDLNLPTDQFYFDHKYMEKCHSALNSLEERLSDCAGSCYFEFQLQFFKEHYILYDGAVEGYGMRVGRMVKMSVSHNF